MLTTVQIRNKMIFLSSYSRKTLILRNVGNFALYCIIFKSRLKTVRIYIPVHIKPICLPFVNEFGILDFINRTRKGIVAGESITLVKSSMKHDFK